MSEKPIQPGLFNGMVPTEKEKSITVDPEVGTKLLPESEISQDEPEENRAPYTKEQVLKALERGYKIFMFTVWGEPGVGKTTLFFLALSGDEALSKLDTPERRDLLVEGKWNYEGPEEITRGRYFNFFGIPHDLDEVGNIKTKKTGERRKLELKEMAAGERPEDYE